MSLKSATKLIHFLFVHKEFLVAMDVQYMWFIVSSSFMCTHT
jgi:hypothetical protein